MSLMSIVYFFLGIIVLLMIVAFVRSFITAKNAKPDFTKTLLPNASDKEREYCKIFLDARMCLQGESKNYREAIDILEKALTTVDSDYIFYTERAEFRKENGDYKGAIEDALKAVELLDSGVTSMFNKIKYSNNVSMLNLMQGIGKSVALVALSQAYYGLKDYDKAVLYATESLNNDNENDYFGKALFVRAEAKLAMGEKEDALKDFESYKENLVKKIEEIDNASKGGSLGEKIQDSLQEVQQKIDALKNS